MDLRIALGVIHDGAIERGDKECERASLIVRKAIEDAQSDIQNCRRAFSGQQRCLERIYNLAKNPNSDSISKILTETEEILAFNLPRDLY